MSWCVERKIMFVLFGMLSFQLSQSSFYKYCSTECDIDSNWFSKAHCDYRNDSLMVCTINQSYKHTNKCFTLINICFYPFMSTLITASLKKTIVTQYENRTCACLRRQTRPNQINNLAMYYPFNTLNFSTKSSL